MPERSSRQQTSTQGRGPCPGYVTSKLAARSRESRPWHLATRRNGATPSEPCHPPLPLLPQTHAKRAARCVPYSAPVWRVTPPPHAPAPLQSTPSQGPNATVTHSNACFRATFFERSDIWYSPQPHHNASGAEYLQIAALTCGKIIILKRDAKGCQTHCVTLWTRVGKVASAHATLVHV